MDINKDKILEALKDPIIYIFLICIIIQCIIYKTVPEYNLMLDSKTYLVYEKDILKGEVDELRTPVYPYFIKIIRAMGGEANLYINIVTVQKVLFLISIIILYFTLNKLINSKILITVLTLCFGICPMIFLWNTFILTESLALFETIILFYLTISYLKEHKIYQAICIGLLLLIMVMTKPASIFLIVAYLAFWILKFIFDKKERKQTIFGISSVILCIIIILVYCLAEKQQYGRFEITCVHTTNKLVNVINSGIYKYGDNKDIVKIIDDNLENSKSEASCWNACAIISDNYSVEQRINFSKSAIKNAKLEYCKQIIFKTIELSDKLIGENYISQTYNAISAIIIPANFGFVYVLLIGTFIYIIYYFIKYKEIEWYLSFMFVVIAGSIFVAVVGAPFETRRLCLNIIPAILMLIGYILQPIILKTIEYKK